MPLRSHAIGPVPEETPGPRCASRRRTRRASGAPDGAEGPPTPITGVAAANGRSDAPDELARHGAHAWCPRTVHRPGGRRAMGRNGGGGGKGSCVDGGQLDK
jgi:hypothetical protein